MIDSAGDSARGAGLSKPEGANVCVIVVLCVQRVLTRSTMDISWSFEENVTVGKLNCGGLEV